MVADVRKVTELVQWLQIEYFPEELNDFLLLNLWHEEVLICLIGKKTMRIVIIITTS